MIDDHKLKQMVARDCPLAYEQFFGRKYMLPNYRQSDYGRQEFEQLVAFDRCLQFAGGVFNPSDEVQRAAIANSLASLNYKRPTLFLERELGEAFLRAELPENFTTGEIKWRWNAFKVWLPLGLLSIERGDGIRSLTHFDISQMGPNNPIRCPKDIAIELDRFASKLIGTPNTRRLEKSDFMYERDGVCISAPLDKPEHSKITQTLYGLTKPWGAVKFGQYRAIKGSLMSPISKDESDDKLIARLEYLILQVMLYLGAYPIEYTSQRMIRPMKREGKNVIPGLFDAHFVGQSQLRAYRPSEPTAKMVSKPTGKHVAAHWVAGHWKRVTFGKGGAERRLQWIMTYTTHDPEMENTT
jgi:hypothetical protein